MVIGRTLLLDELHNAVNLVVGDEAALDALGLAPVDLGEEHVAVAGELLGAHLIDDDPAVDARGNVEGDAVGDVRLDQAGHHVGAGALRGDDEVDAGRAAQLGNADDARLDVLARDHHEVGELIDDDHEVGDLGGRVVIVLEGTGGLLLVEGRNLANADALEHLEAALHRARRPRRPVSR